jgi:ABC-type transport system involved in cytochrome bd biosynthesis fused ATPase/permease subunit
MNLEAWIWLAGAGIRGGTEARLALARIAALDPRK